MTPTMIIAIVLGVTFGVLFRIIFREKPEQSRPIPLDEVQYEHGYFDWEPGIEDEFDDDDVVVEDVPLGQEMTTRQLQEMQDRFHVATIQSGLRKQEAQSIIEKGGVFQDRLIGLLREFAGRPQSRKPQLVPPVVPQFVATPVQSNTGGFYKTVVIVALALVVYQFAPTIKQFVVEKYDAWQEARAQEDFRIQQLVDERAKNTVQLIAHVQDCSAITSATDGSSVLTMVVRVKDGADAGLYTLSIKGEVGDVQLLSTALKFGKVIKFTRHPEMQKSRRGVINVTEIAVIK